MAITPKKREAMETLIYDFFTAFDKTGTNTNHYKILFQKMSDAEFDRYFKAFFANKKAYLVLNVADYENNIKLEDIERAAKVLKIPLFENVYLPLTAQVTGADKNGRESDVENTMLVSMDMVDTLRELNGPRADDLVMKNQMLQEIALNGYARLDDLEDNPENKTTLNTVNVFLLGMGLNSDLVTSGLMLKSELKKEL